MRRGQRIARLGLLKVRAHIGDGLALYRPEFHGALLCNMARMTLVFAAMSLMRNHRRVGVFG